MPKDKMGREPGSKNYGKPPVKKEKPKDKKKK